MIIGFDKCNIIIFNIKIGKQIKRYQIMNINSKSCFFNNMDIKQWDNIKNNEFLLFIDKIIVLLELNEYENDNVELKIISQLSFPNFDEVIKIKDKINKFCCLDKKNIFFGKNDNYICLYENKANPD